MPAMLLLVPRDPKHRAQGALLQGFRGYYASASRAGTYA